MVAFTQVNPGHGLLAPPKTAEERMVEDFVDALERRVGKKGADTTFREFVDAVHPGFKWYRHLVILAAVLQKVADGVLNRVMVFMPPRHGKSETISRLFSAYYLWRYPDRWVGQVAYQAGLAQSFSRIAQERFQAFGGILNPRATAVGHWETYRGGGMWAAGIGGPITGKGAHLALIDDPIKNSQEAASETYRKNHQEWYESTFDTRLEPGAAVIITLTRWHGLDLAGWQLKLEEEAAKAADAGDDLDGAPQRWHVVSFPALFDIPREPGETDADLDELTQADIQARLDAMFPTTCTVEPDFRTQQDEALAPERYNADTLKRRRKRMSPYYWNALFQQRPQPREGGLFKRSKFKVEPAAPKCFRYIRFWDYASGDGTGDYTAGVLLGLRELRERGEKRKAGELAEHQVWILDIVRGQWESGERDRIVRSTAALDQSRYGLKVQQWREQEPGSSGKDTAKAFKRLLRGFIAKSKTSTGDKVVRADPLASQVSIDNVYLLAGDWVEAFLDEAALFPYGPNDDQVDAAGNAYNVAEGRAFAWAAEDFEPVTK